MMKAVWFVVIFAFVTRLPAAAVENHGPKSQQLEQGLGGAQIKIATIPPGLKALANFLGRPPEELKQLADKYSVDFGNLPVPPNGQVASLFNDLQFDAVLTELRTSYVQTGTPEAKLKVAQHVGALLVAMYPGHSATAYADTLNAGKIVFDGLTLSTVGSSGKIQFAS